MAYQVPYDNDSPYLSVEAKVDKKLLKGAKNLGQNIFQGAKQFLPQAHQQFDELREDLEGPRPLRVVAGLGGLALAAVAALGSLHFKQLATHPAQFVLTIYLIFFGLMITVVEIKAFFSPGNALKKFSYRWFPFLTILGGKGVFYIFTGSLGLGFNMDSFFTFVPSCFVIIVGIIYICFHFGRCEELREKFDQVHVSEQQQHHSLQQQMLMATNAIMEPSR